MLKIRLARVGKKKSPTYRFVVSESARDLYGNHLEHLGHYNPFTKVCEVNKDRILYWISVGAQVSPTAHNLLVDQNVITKAKVKASKTGSRKKAAAEAAAKPAEAPKPAPAEATTPAEPVAEVAAPAEPVIEAAAPVAAPQAPEAEKPAEVSSEEKPA